LAAQLTVNTMPEPTLKAFADHGKIGAARPMRDGDGGAVLKQFASAGVGVGVEAFSAQLQEQGAISFIKSWNDLFWVISSKSAVLRNAAYPFYIYILMNPRRRSLTQMPAWKPLADHSNDIKQLHLRELFTKNVARGKTFTAEGAGLFLDYSKN